MQIMSNPGGGKKLGRVLTQPNAKKTHPSSDIWMVTESEIESLRQRVDQIEKKFKVLIATDLARSRF